MKKIFIILLSSCVFLNLCCSILWSVEEKKEVKTHPSAEDIKKAQQVSSQRPILPPVSPMPMAMVSPTPSPQIATPHITPQVINPITQVNNTPRIPGPASMQSIPSTPTYAVPPNASVFVDMPQAPVIGNTIGKVAKLGLGNDGIPWIEVNDNLFGTLVKVKVKNLRNIPIVKAAQIYNFKDIKIGDSVNAMFHTEGDDNIANFIDVMTEEEIEMFNKTSNTELTVTPKKSEDLNKSPAVIDTNR